MAGQKEKVSQHTDLFPNNMRNVLSIWIFHKQIKAKASLKYEKGSFSSGVGLF